MKDYSTMRIMADGGIVEFIFSMEKIFNKWKNMKEIYYTSLGFFWDFEFGKNRKWHMTFWMELIYWEFNDFFIFSCSEIKKISWDVGDFNLLGMIMQKIDKNEFR